MCSSESTLSQSNVKSNTTMVNIHFFSTSQQGAPDIKVAIGSDGATFDVICHGIIFCATLLCTGEKREVSITLLPSIKPCSGLRNFWVRKRNYLSIILVVGIKEKVRNGRCLRSPKLKIVKERRNNVVREIQGVPFSPSIFDVE